MAATRIRDKETARLAEQAESAGWTVGKTRNNHIVFAAPTGQKVFTSSTPGDKRATKNLRAQLRRAGLAVD